jgi:hypothetical protein
MSEVTYFVALPFVATDDGIAVGEVRVAPWRIHDLRRTCATEMGNLGVAPHVIEAVLSQVSGEKAGVAGVYNIRAHAPEKKAALERWAAHLAGLVSDRPTSVVPLQQAGA